MIKELVYGDKEVENIIKGKYPDAVITDASDYIHTERFELEIAGVDDDEFYPFAIREGFGPQCFSLVLLVQGLRFPETRKNEHRENANLVDKWIKAAKELK